MDSNVIDLAINKKYTEFSDAVKAELKSKISNHDISKKYTSDYDKIQQMKNIFSKINNPEEE